MIIQNGGKKARKTNSKCDLSKMGKKQNDIPEDINKELESPKFGKPTELTASGYILDVNETDNKVDIQTYEPISGSTILEGLYVLTKSRHSPVMVQQFPVLMSLQP